MEWHLRKEFDSSRSASSRLPAAPRRAAYASRVKRLTVPLDAAGRAGARGELSRLERLPVLRSIDPAQTSHLVGAKLNRVAGT